MCTTPHRYHLPLSDRLSPVIYAQAGGDDPDAAVAAVTAGAGSVAGVTAHSATMARSVKSPWGLLDGGVDGVFGFLAGIPTAIIGGARPLFKQVLSQGRIQLGQLSCS